MSTKKNDRADLVLRQALPHIQRELSNPMHTHVILTVAALLLAGCGGTAVDTTGSGDDAGPQVICGPGTQLVGNECLPVPSAEDSGGAWWLDEADAATAREDAGDEADGGIVFVEVDAGPASGFAVDPAHDNALATAAVKSPLTPAWTAQFTGAVSYPVVAGDLVIVSADESQPDVRALDLSTGTLAWGPIVMGETVLLAVEGPKLFALDGAGNLLALDAQTGSSIWATQIEGQIDFWSPPVALGGLVYVNGLESGGTTYAIDEATGTTVWAADTFDGSDGTVAVGGGVVYEAEACQQVSAFNAFSGALNWYHQTSCTGGGGAAPAYYDGHIWVRDDVLGNVVLDTSGNVTGSFAATVVPSFYAGTAFYLNATEEGTSTLTAVTVASNTEKWSFSGDDELCTSAVIAGAGGQVFVGSTSGNVYELNETTGAQVSVSDAGGPVSCGSETQSMGLSAGHLLVPTGNTLVVY